MKTGAIVMAGAFLAVSAGQALGQDYDTKTLRAIGQGRALYLQHCAACHGPLGHGNAALTLGTDGKTCAPSDLTTITARDGRYDALHVANHIQGRSWGKCPPGMPCWQQVFKKTQMGDFYSYMQIHKLVRYLAWVQQEAPVLPEVPE